MALTVPFCFRSRDYKLRITLGFLVLCLSFVGLFCVLGEWQLYRYHFKKALLSTYQERSNATPKPLTAIADNKADIQFQRVIVTGQYLNALTLFVQNRVYDDKLGFEVLTPVQIPGQQKLLLVDRGWVPKPADSDVPIIADVVGEQQMTGDVKIQNEFQFMLGKNILQPDHTPIVMQKVDIKDISEATHQSFYPFVLRLGANEKNGFVRDWMITAVNPERHLGYAVQWFLMAIVLLIAYLSFCIERTGSKVNANL